LIGFRIWASESRYREWALDFLTRLLTFCWIATVDQSVISQALASPMSDLEDAVQYEAAMTWWLAWGK
jgi:hypothetical protein